MPPLFLRPTLDCKIPSVLPHSGHLLGWSERDPRAEAQTHRAGWAMEIWSGVSLVFVCTTVSSQNWKWAQRVGSMDLGAQHRASSPEATSLKGQG
jgi:hypothetical protein